MRKIALATVICSLGLAVPALADAASPGAADGDRALPGVKLDHRIVKPAPSEGTPAAEPDDAASTGDLKAGPWELHIHGAVSYEIGFGGNGRYVMPRR